MVEAAISNGVMTVPECKIATGGFRVSVPAMAGAPVSRLAGAAVLLCGRGTKGGGRLGCTEAAGVSGATCGRAGAGGFACVAGEAVIAGFVGVAGRLMRSGSGRVSASGGGRGGEAIGRGSAGAGGIACCSRLRARFVYSC